MHGALPRRAFKEREVDFAEQNQLKQKLIYFMDELYGNKCYLF